MDFPLRRRIAGYFSPVIFAAALFVLLSCSRRATPLDESRGSRLAASVEDEKIADSLAAEYRRALAGLTSPALERRKADRRRLQKRGHVEVLADVLRSDGPGALLAFARMRLQLEFSLPHDLLVAYSPIVVPDTRRDSLPGFTTFGSRVFAVPLIEDRAFPRDPWENP